MPIRVPRTSLPQEPQRPSAAGGQAIVPVQAIGNPAAAMVRPVQQAAGLAAELYQEDRTREIQTRVLEVDIERRRADAAVVDQYRQMQGKDAVERRGEVMAAITENSKRIREGIKDRSVADVWATQDEPLTFAAQQQIDDHFRGQSLRWKADTQEARVDLLVSSVGRVAFGEGYDQSGQLSVEAERTRSAYLSTIGELGGVLGWSTEQVERYRRKADTAAYGQVAESLIRQERFDEATKVLDRHSAAIDVGTRDQLAQQARDGRTTLSERARREVVKDTAAKLALRLIRDAKTPALPDDAVSIAGPRFGPPVPPVEYAQAILNQALEADGINAELRDLTMAYVEKAVDADMKREAGEAKQVVIAAERFLDENKLATLESNPRLFEAAKRHGVLEGLREYQKNHRYGTDPLAVVEAEAIPDSVLVTTDPVVLWRKYRLRLGNQHLDALMSRRDRAMGKATDDQLYALSLKERIARAARTVGILPPNEHTTTSQAQQENSDAWSLKLEGYIKAAYPGKKPTIAEAQKVIDGVATDHVQRFVDEPWYNALWFGSNDHYITEPLSVVPGGRKNASIVIGGERIELARVPESEWDANAEELRKSGVLQPSTRAIVELWVREGKPGDTKGR